MSMYYRYFIFSSEEEAKRIRVQGPNAKFGSVNVKGIAKRYTSIVIDPNTAPSDALVIAKGDIRKMKFTSPGR